MLTREHFAGPRLLIPVVLVFGLFSNSAAQNPPGGSPQPPTTGWKIKFDESGSSPVIADGALYIGSADGAVYALDPATGETKWRFQTGESLSPGGQIITVPKGTSAIDHMVAGMKAAETQKERGIKRVDMTPVVENGTVFIGSGDRAFYAIDAATGKKKWSYDAGYAMANNNNTSFPVPPAIVRDGTIYFATADGLHAIDALTGKRKWLFETWQTNYFDTKHAALGPVLGDGVIYLTIWVYLDPNTRKGFLHALDSDSGKAKWVTSVNGQDITSPTTAKGLIFFAVEEPGPTVTSSTNRETIYAINATDGQIKWKVGAGRKYATQLIIAGDAIYFSTDTNLLALQLETGHQIWSFSADEISGIHIDNERLYVTTHKGSIMRPKDTLHALALSTGQEKWSQDFGGSALVAAVQDGVVYAGGGHLHAIDAATGKELWSFKGTGRESMRLISGSRIFLTSPTVDYIGTKRVDQGYLYALDAKTGKLKP